MERVFKRVFNLFLSLISLVLYAVAGAFWLIGAAFTLVRVAIVLTVLGGLGVFIYEYWPDDPPKRSVYQQMKPRGGGEAATEQSEEDRWREAASAARARARYQAEERRMVEQGRAATDR